MRGGLVTKAAETVRLVRCCRHILNSPDQKSLPPVNLFANLGLDHTLGDMLDALFEKWSDGSLSSDAHGRITDAYLFIERYPRDWEAELLLKFGTAQFMVQYQFL